jgi:peptidoglycan/xylan/chitin deacetylase (PgdA/CDA1 family)
VIANVGQRLQRAWQRLAGGTEPPPLILMYHRIAQDAIDPWQLCVSPHNFAAQMQVIRRHRQPMPLAELTRQLQQGHCPRGAVVVTFDDGYRDNLLAALPVLEAHDVPATVFCAAGFIGRDEPFWWDRLAALLLAPERLPATLALDVTGRQWRKDLGAAVSYGAAERASDRSAASDSPRMAFYREVWSWLRPLTEGDRALALAALAQWSAGATVAEAPIALSQQQLRALAASRLIEIGAHSVTHAALPALAPQAQRHEIAQSKAQLEAMVERPVQHFAYPFGDQSADTAALVRDAGFHSSCTTEHGAVRAGNDLFQLPRIAVGNWNGETFAASLQGIG